MDLKKEMVSKIFCFSWETLVLVNYELLHVAYHDHIYISFDFYGDIIYLYANHRGDTCDPNVIFGFLWSMEEY